MAPTWKFCIHCGLAIDEPEIPGAIRPDGSTSPKPSASPRILVIGGIGIFVIGIALLVIAIAFFAGAFR